MKRHKIDSYPLSSLNRTIYRRLILGSLLTCVPIGLLTKVYPEIGHGWLGGYAGAILYEIFWILLICGFKPHWAVWKVSLGVMLTTDILEVLQYWQLPILAELQATSLGKLLLGSVFSIWDFLYYAIGSLLGYFWMKLIYQSASQHEHNESNCDDSTG